jgi:hypothetical protein
MKKARKIKYRTLNLSIQDVEIIERRAGANNKFCDRVNVPLGWKGKKVLVVLLK